MNIASMKTEANGRMLMLGLPLEIIKKFSADNKLMCSDGASFVEVPEEIQKQIAAWEKKYKNLVYHVIHTPKNSWEFNGHKALFETYECLCISHYKEDWSYEKACLNDFYPMAHVINVSVPDYTETGLVQIENRKGILKRIG
jgi:hypothetical protein